MIFRNSTDYADSYLRAMLRWCVRKVEVPKDRDGRRLNKVRFTKCRRSYRGLAAYWSGEILVRIGPPELFPANVAWRPAYRAEGMTEWLLDRDAVLVHITAHELAHVRLGRIGQARNNEMNADSIARFVTKEFLADRDALQAAWRGATPAETPEAAVPETPAADTLAVQVAAAKPKLSLQERRALKAAAMLAKWTRRLKIAQRKAQKYRRTLKYYDRVAATKAK